MEEYKYQWHGQPVKAIFGFVEVKEVKDKPLYWFNYEALECVSEFGQHCMAGRAFISAIQVTTENSTFYISNHFGIGSYKLQKGGWPNVGHFSFDHGFIKFYEDHKTHEDLYGDLDLEGFEKHEASRRKWQIETYPEEAAKSEKLRQFINSTKP